MFSDKLHRYAQEQFQKRYPFLGTLGVEVEERLKGCSEDEKVLMKFLYGTMPIRDAGEYEFRVFLGFVRHSLMVRDTMDWCKGIPEDVFLHHILYYRVNSENIEDCRRFFYDSLIPRIKGLSLREAVVEINYWCGENGSYEASDQRTISPMTLYRSGKGRCGEESTFLVTALRGVGIPARQVYTPRWAHCDDNHAWVEAYVDGDWCFLGACEPEEVLNKGWFTNASSRAMLIHSRTFSDYSCGEGEESLGREELLFYYNHTSAYARTKIREISVMDEKGQPEEGVHLWVELMNSGEYSRVAKLVTDREGKAAITLGLGDFRLRAVKDGRTCERLVKAKEESQILMVLKEGDVWDKRQWEDEDVKAPEDYPMHPVTLTREQKERNRERIRAAAVVRLNRVEGYYREEFGELYPKEKEILKLAAGNIQEILHFLGRDQNPDRRPLLHSLSQKDYKDAKAEILESHLQNVCIYRKKWEEKGEAEIYTQYLLCPRIFYEELTPYAGVIRSCFTPKEQETFRTCPETIWDYILEHIRFDPSLDYSTLFWTPGASLKLGQGNPMSRKILFVAVCRTLGIPARINRVNLEAEYYADGRFLPLGEPSSSGPSSSEPSSSGLSSSEPSSSEPSSSGLSSSEPSSSEPSLGLKSGRLCLVSGEDGWVYYQNWTLARLEEGVFVTLDYTGAVFEKGRFEGDLEPGAYRILTSTRLPNGNQLVSQYRFCLGEKERHIVEMKRRKGEIKELLVSHELEDFPLMLEGNQVLASHLTENHANILAFLAPGEEPTEHVLNEILDQKEAFGRLEAAVWFIVEDQGDLEDPTLEKVLRELPEIRVAYGAFEEIGEPLARRMYVDPDKRPLLIVTDRGLHGIYGCSGYNVGSVGMMAACLSRGLESSGKSLMD